MGEYNGLMMAPYMVFMEPLKRSSPPPEASRSTLAALSSYQNMRVHTCCYSELRPLESIVFIIPRF